MSFRTVTRAARRIPMSELVAAAEAKNAKFAAKNGSASSLDEKIAAFNCDAPRVRALVAEIYEDFGETFPTSGLRTPVKFVDGAVLVYKGEVIFSWTGNKGVNVKGHDIIMDRCDRTIKPASAGEIRSAMESFFARDGMTGARRLLRYLAKVL